MPELTHEFSPQDKIDLRFEKVRQDRVNTTLIGAYLNVQGTEYPIMDCTPFSVAVHVDTSLEGVIKAEEALLIIDDVTTQSLFLKYVRSQKYDNIRSKVVFEVVGPPIDMTMISTAHETVQLLAAFRENFKTLKEVPNEFRNRILSLKDSLIAVDMLTKQVESKIVQNTRYEQAIAEETAAKILSKFLAMEIRIAFNDLAASIVAIDPITRKKCFEYFRSQIRPFVDPAPFLNRTYYKPLGYAGDFEMMNMIYRAEPIGETLFAKALHLLSVNIPEADAVRQRAIYIKDKIKQHFFASPKINFHTSKILSVASGSAMEVQLLLQEDHDFSKMEFHFLDQDIHSLKYAQRQLYSASKDRSFRKKFKFSHLNIKDIINSEFLDRDYDFIYSAGLFDYLPDQVAVAIAEKLAHCLKPGGQLIIGNCDMMSPSRLYFELVSDWFLIYRSEADLKDLFGHIGTTQMIEKTQEEENVNLFCVIKK